MGTLFIFLIYSARQKYKCDECGSDMIEDASEPLTSEELETISECEKKEMQYDSLYIRRLRCPKCAKETLKREYISSGKSRTAECPVCHCRTMDVQCSRMNERSETMVCSGSCRDPTCTAKKEAWTE